jgi:hypothetical protein
MRSAAVLVLAIALLAACSPQASTPGWSLAPADRPSPPPAGSERVVTVYKSPTCGCCHEWEAYLRGHGYAIESVPTEDMAAVKARYGLPESTWSCHTATIAGHVIEGHVPVEAIEDLLAGHPVIDAIALPGMPEGSPGMAGVKDGPFEILSITDGEIGVFGSY